MVGGGLLLVDVPLVSGRVGEGALLESDEVAVQEIEVSEHKDLHARYSIDAVPMIVVVDDEGVTRASFIGVPTAADLWAALAELRAAG